MHVRIAIQTRENSGNDDSVFQRVARAGRSLGAIAGDANLAVRFAGDVRGVKMQLPSSGLRDSVAGMEEPRVPVDQLRWQDPAANQFLRTIDIRQDQIEKFRTL